jgi:D-amino-acid dehydrogenase
MQQESLRLFEQFDASGLEFGLQRKGTMTVFNTQKAFEEGVREADLLKGHGIKFQVLFGEKVREKEPLLKESVVGGIYFPGDAHLDPAQFVLALAKEVGQKGVKVLTQTEVIELRARGNIVESVVTTKGQFKADTIVLAAGAWSSNLVLNLGIKIPIQPAKGYSITFYEPNLCIHTADAQRS